MEYIPYILLIAIFVAFVLIMIGRRNDETPHQAQTKQGDGVGTVLKNIPMKSFGRFFISCFLSLRKINIASLIGLILAAYIGYLGWYYLYGRESVLVTHYVVAGVDGTCIEENAINGEIESLTMRRWESYTFSVPTESRRCYTPLSRLRFKIRNHRRTHVVSLR